ncbi:MAG TPA: penicillin acylase family protein [Vicinamibacterales bacterium]|nr:penicillin acylase family protein [Vicinamibacterales bacterium]
MGPCRHHPCGRSRARSVRSGPGAAARALARRRGEHGVPHIRAQNLRAAGYALAWVMSEDYGSRTGMRLLGARGELSRFEGRARLDADVENLHARARAIATYHLLDQETRDIYDGFAAGVNRYVSLHADEFPAGMPADFSGYDVATLHIGDGPPAARVRRFLAAQGVAASGDPAAIDETTHDDDGSNAWALAPGRTTSGKAILLRNPHLAWTAGYYEAHLTVPGVVDFYGDFRVGGPLIVIGGFNKDLGWATTNSNSGDLTEIYALDRDPKAADRYLLDGASLPLERESWTVEYKDGDAMRPETRELWSAPLGRVIHRTAEKIFIARTAGDGEFRAGEQFLRMMRATSLAGWKDAMKIRALVTSNYTYADRAGNIFSLWNAALPELPHPAGGDAATPVRATGELWTRYIPFEALPQLRNPPGGYLHNENDSPHFANVRRRVNLVNAYPNIEPPMLRLRSQHAIALIGGSRKLSLEDVIRLKHSYRMLLADRVKPDLVAAVRAAKPAGDVAAALSMLRRWNNTAAPASRGAALFEIWFQRYSQGRQPDAIFAREWDAADPLATPRGLADGARAAEAFEWAVAETARRFGRWDVAWGDVHRVRRGSVDVPVGGCSGQMGCFRVLGFAREADGKLAANTGDGWVLAVEFGAIPRAYSVLAYGQSPQAESPWHADQAAMFARGELKKVAFTARDVEAAASSRYRPGER